MRKRLFISLLFLCALLLSACAALRAAPEASAPEAPETQPVSEPDIMSGDTFVIAQIQ